MRRGLTATVLVLIALAGGTGIYAAVIRPETSIPDPGSSSIDLMFGPTYFAHSPMTVTLSLSEDQEKASVDSPARTTVTLVIDLKGKDLTYPGWSLLAFVPTGVQMVGAVDNSPRTGKVTQHLAAGGASVYYTPGPLAQGKDTVILFWDNLTSGPIRVQGANLVAAFPDFAVENLTAAGSQDTFPPPTPKIKVGRELQPEGDYTYLGGLPPDHQNRFTWSWKPEAGQRGSGGSSLPSLTVEARSATFDEQTHNEEFQSGIFFGVAAAAAIAAIQEFMKSATDRKRKRQRTPADA